MSQLRELYQVSSTVIRDALNELRREGLIEGQQGKGVFVRERPTGTPATSDEASEIHRRLDTLTKAIRRLDERLSQLEETSAQDSQAPSQAKRAAD
jgi:DNA-binding FadR family transcriptional regulator